MTTPTAKVERILSVMARLMGIMADLLAKLPPVPPSLKSITPYLQRAEELRIQDPVIAYWCKYNYLRNILLSYLPYFLKVHIMLRKLA
jgi:hypothetical protein